MLRTYGVQANRLSRASAISALVLRVLLRTRLYRGTFEDACLALSLVLLFPRQLPLAQNLSSRPRVCVCVCVCVELRRHLRTSSFFLSPCLSPFVSLSPCLFLSLSLCLGLSRHGRPGHRKPTHPTHHATHRPLRAHTNLDSDRELITLDLQLGYLAPRGFKQCRRARLCRRVAVCIRARVCPCVLMSACVWYVCTYARGTQRL